MPEWIVKEDPDIELGMHGRAKIGVLGGAINQIEFKTYQWCASLGLRGGKGFCSKGERRPDAD